MELNEGDVVLCTVLKIVGTNVFVKIQDNGEGSIITSEISSGRIRNIRDYVVVNKKIVCKILRIKEGHIDLSLRRVTLRERKETLEIYDKEKTSLSILKSVLENAEEIAGKIREKSSLYDFLQKAKENPKQLEKIVSKSDGDKIIKILKERKEKEKIIKKEFVLKSNSKEGIVILKDILKDNKQHIRYISAGRYSISIKSGDFKKANLEINQILKTIESKAKKNKVEFSISEK